MKERKLPIIWAAIGCIASGAFGAAVGYRMGGFTVWPHDEMLTQCLCYGAAIGVLPAVVTGALLLAAAQEKLWLVALVGCLAAFGGGCVYGSKQANELYEWAAPRIDGKIPN